MSTYAVSNMPVKLSILWIGVDVALFGRILNKLLT